MYNDCRADCGNFLLHTTFRAARPSLEEFVKSQHTTGYDGCSADFWECVPCAQRAGTSPRTSVLWWNTHVKRDLQKRHTKKTNKKGPQKKELQKRHVKETCKHQMRPSKETYTKDLYSSVLTHLRITQCWDATHMSKETHKRDIQKKPTKKTYKRKSYKRDLEKRLVNIKRDHQRNLHKRRI